jgi:hypothetical protein
MYQSQQASVTRLFAASLVLITAASWLTGCVGASVRSTWAPDAPHDQTFTKILVVGVTPNRDLRCEFESTFASQLKSTATTVITSCSQMGAQEPLTRETVERAVAATHADAVLATRLVSAQTSQGQGNGRDTRGDSRYKATDFGYGAYGMPVTELEFQTAPPLTSITSSIHVVTRLYDARDGKLVYTLDTKTKAHDIDSTQATLMTITAPTADRLRHEGLIR